MIAKHSDPDETAFTGFIQAGLSKIQGLLKDFPTVFHGLKFMKNTDLSVKFYFRNARLR